MITDLKEIDKLSTLVVRSGTDVALQVKSGTSVLNQRTFTNAEQALPSELEETLANMVDEVILGSVVRAVKDANGNIVTIINDDGTPASAAGSSITTATTSVRGVAHRGGWPLNSPGNQLFGASMWLVSPGTEYQLCFVGATGFRETAARAGQAQAWVEAPFGSNNWYTVNFSANPVAQFIQTGTSPDAGNNYFVIDSDIIPVTFTEKTMIRVVMSAKGGWPTMSNFDGYYQGRAGLEFSIQNASTNDAALQLGSIGPTQVANILTAVEEDGIGMTPRVATGYSYTGTALRINVPAHGTTTTGNKIVLSGFSNGLDGVYSFTVFGGDAVDIVMDDPGTITTLGIVRAAQAITSVTQSGGILTFTRAGHGRVPGDAITVRGSTATGSSINGDHRILTADTDTFTVAFANSIGSVSLTNAYMFPKYFVPSADYHLRPYTIRAKSNIVCLGLAGDSTTHTVGRIFDDTRLSGVLQQLVGRVFPFQDYSANSEGVTHWNSTPGEVVIREFLMSRDVQGIVYGYDKNDESAFTSVAQGNAAHDSWWARPVQASLANSKFNILVTPPSRAITSRDAYTSVEGQSRPTSAILPKTQAYKIGKLGSLYHKHLAYGAELTVRGQPYAYKVWDDTPTFTFTTTAGSPIVIVSGTEEGSAFSRVRDGAVVLLPGAGNSGADLYARVLWVNSGQFIAMNPNQGINIPIKAPDVTITAVTNGTGRVNPRRCIAFSSGQADSIHENPPAMYAATQAIALRTPADF